MRKTLALLALISIEAHSVPDTAESTNNATATCGFMPITKMPCSDLCPSRWGVSSAVVNHELGNGD